LSGGRAIQLKTASHYDGFSYPGEPGESEFFPRHNKTVRTGNKRRRAGFLLLLFFARQRKVGQRRADGN